MQAIQHQITNNTFDLEIATRIKNRVKREVATIRNIATELDAVKAVELCDSAVVEIDEEQFKIVVVGEFTRGKSTFINALLGDRVLPSGIHPVTTILTRIQHSSSPEYRLRYRNGRREGIAREDFFRIVAPAEPDPGDEKAVAEWQSALDQFAKIETAEIGYPSELCRNGVEIVDTPGTNDINPAREQITYEFIPKADAILFMLSALDAIGQSEIDFLKDRVLKSDVQRIFFILNFADMLSAGDRERVAQYVERQLRTVVERPRLYLMSSKEALRIRRMKEEVPDIERLEATGLPAFERDLAVFLIEDRTPIKLRKPVYAAMRACRSLREEVFSVVLAAQDLTYSELQRTINALQPEIRHLQRQRDHAINQFRTGMDDRLPEVRRQLRTGMEEITEAAAVAVRTYTGPLEKPALVQAIERAVASKETHLHELMNQAAQQAVEAEYSRAERDIKTAADAALSGIFKDSAAYGKGLEGFGDAEATEGLVAALQTGGGLAGLGALAIVFHFLIPVALLAIPFLKGIFNALRELRRGKTLLRLENDIRAAYSDRSREAGRAFEQKWEILTRDLADRLGQGADTRIRDLDVNLKTLLRQASENEKRRAEQRARFDKLAADLRVSERELLRLSKWSACGDLGTATA